MKLSHEGLVYPLGLRTVLGRGGAAKVRIALPYASKLHASVEWAKSEWVIRDLGSRNGTFVNGCRLEPEQRKGLLKGDVVGLGNPSGTLRVLSTEPPEDRGAYTKNKMIDLDAARLTFLVSSDHERVRVVVEELNKKRIVLEMGEHRYLMLLLARARIADSTGEKSLEGWMSNRSLQSMLMLNGPSVESMVLSARSQFSAVGILNGEKIVETRRGGKRMGPQMVSLKRVLFEAQSGSISKTSSLLGAFSRA